MTVDRGPSSHGSRTTNHGSRTTDHGPRTLIGWLGELAPGVVADLPGGRRVLALELALPPLRAAAQGPDHRPLPRSPASKRDLSLVVPEGVAEGRIRAVLLAEPLVESAFLYDLYQGAGLPAGHLSLTYEVAFRDPERTLASEEVDRAVSQILARLDRVGVRIR